LGTTVTNQDFIDKEIRRRLNSSNACYHSIKNILSSHLLSKNVKIRIPLRCKSWSLTLSEEPSLRVFENRAMKRIF
jgi:hypothetical protein